MARYMQVIVINQALGLWLNSSISTEARGRSPRDEVAYNSLQTARGVNNYFIARLRMLSVAVRDNDL